MVCPPSHTSAQNSVEYQSFIDECRIEAFRRARMVQEALPEGDFWARVEWLERTFDITCGSLVEREPAKGRKRPVGACATISNKRQRVGMRNRMSSSEDESSDGDFG